MKLSRILKISRPRFWIYELGPYVIGIAAAIGMNHHLWLSPLVIIFFIFFTYPANAYIYGINDIYDYETDKLNPKKVEYESLVLPSERKALFSHIALVTVPFLIYGLLVLPLPALISLIAFFFFAGFYSAPPIRAKARPFFDSIFSAGHYIATAVFSFLAISFVLKTEIAWPTLITCIIAGMAWAISMHAYSAIPDIDADTDAHLETIATKLQKKKSIYLCSALYALSAIIVYPFIGFISLLLGIVYLYFMYISLKASKSELFKIYTYFPILNTISGMIIFFSVLSF